MCGVFGIRAPGRDVARIAYFGLFALQHRGQESAGIAVSDHGRMTTLRDMGLVTQVFNEEKRGPARRDRDRARALLDDWLDALVERAAGRAPRSRAHGRARPQQATSNAAELRDELRAQGVRASSTSDSELIAALLATDEAPLTDAVANAMQRLEGAYSCVALAEGKLLAFRDPLGFRPLVLGRIGDGSSRPRRARSTSSAPTSSATSSAAKSC